MEQMTTMACGCRQYRKPVNVQTVRPGPAVSNVNAQRAPMGRGPTPPGSRFCNLCGWAVKPVVFVHPTTKAHETKMQCTNRTCNNSIL